MNLAKGTEDMLDGITIEDNSTDDRPESDILSWKISENEILLACRKLNNNKSAGEDGITNEYIKASILVCHVSKCQIPCQMQQCKIRLFYKFNWC